MTVAEKPANTKQTATPEQATIEETSAATKQITTTEQSATTEHTATMDHLDATDHVVTTEQGNLQMTAAIKQKIWTFMPTTTSRNAADTELNNARSIIENENVTNFQIVDNGTKPLQVVTEKITTEQPAVTEQDHLQVTEPTTQAFTVTLMQLTSEGATDAGKGEGHSENTIQNDNATTRNIFDNNTTLVNLVTAATERGSPTDQGHPQSTEPTFPTTFVSATSERAADTTGNASPMTEAVDGLNIGIETRRANASDGTSTGRSENSALEMIEKGVADGNLSHADLGLDIDVDKEFNKTLRDLVETESEVSSLGTGNLTGDSVQGSHSGSPSQACFASHAC